MPKTAIIHMPWCHEHQTDFEGEHCFTGGFEFGPMKPPQGDFPAHRMGDIKACQQLAVDDEPKVVIEYGNGGDIEMRVEDLLPLRQEIDGLLDVFGIEVP